MLLPVAAVLRDDDNLPFVFVETAPGAYARRPVTLGGRLGDRFEVRAGPQGRRARDLGGRTLPRVRAESMSDPAGAAPSTRRARKSFVDYIVAAALDQWPIVAFLTLLLVVVGIWSFLRLPVDAYPDLSPPMVEIVTQWPGHAAEEVEQLITAPIELGMNGVPRLKVMRSISLYGLSDVTLTFADGTDDYFARQRVFERLPDVELPAGDHAIGRAALLAVGARLPLRGREPRPLGDGTQGHPGLGAREAVQVGAGRRGHELDGRRDDAVPGGDRSRSGSPRAGSPCRRSRRRSRRTTATPAAASYSEAGQFYYVRGLGRMATVEDIGRTVVAVSNGTPVLVKDIGDVVIGAAPRLGQFGFDSSNDAVEGRHPDAPRRAGADRAQARRGEDARS